MKKLLHAAAAILLSFVMLIGAAACNNTPSEETTYTYSLNETSITLEIGDTKQLSVSVTPEKELGAIVYESANDEVATVSEGGLVTAVATGSTSVTAKVDGKTLTCAVTVNEPNNGDPEYTYTLTPTTATLEVGATQQLTVSVTPEKELGTVTYASANPEIATVSESGLIMAVAAGTTNVTATVDETVLTCKVTVEDNSTPIEYEYALSATELSLKVDDTDTLVVTITPDKAAEVVWMSSEESVATVTALGDTMMATVTAVGAGETVISATVDGNTLNCNVSVEAKPVEYTYTLKADGSAIEDGATLSLNETTKTTTLSVSVNPEKEFTATYTSENEGIATVDTDGVITAIAIGTTQVNVLIDGKTAYTVNVEITASATVTTTVSEEFNGDHKSEADLTVNDNELTTLYWEHYDNNGIISMRNAKDLVASNLDNHDFYESISRFWDYNIDIDWENGNTITAYQDNHNGICMNGVFEFNVTVDASVKLIRVYTGAWRATNTVTVSKNGLVLSTANSFTAGDGGVARFVNITVDVEEETTLTIRITPSEVGEDGNVSATALVVLGQSAVAPTTTATMTKTEMAGKDTSRVNLTEKGQLDWIYFNANDGSGMESAIEMKKTDSHLIDRDSLAIEGNNRGWDYRAIFSWTDGATWTDTLQDDDCGGQGTNNFVYGAYVNIDVTLNSNVHHLYVYASGWTSDYYALLIDSNGNILCRENVAYSNGDSQAFELDFAITATKEDKCTLILYRLNGGNCGFAAVAVS